MKVHKDLILEDPRDTTGLSVEPGLVYLISESQRISVDRVGAQERCVAD